jgi:hypothetical protein
VKDDEAILADVLTLPQEEMGNDVGGALPKRWDKTSLDKTITMPSPWL